MKINLNKSDTNLLLNLFETLELNMSASEVALELVDGFENLDLNTVFNDVKNHNSYLTRIKELYGYNDQDPFQVQLFEKHLLPNIVKRDLSSYQNDPYYQAIKGVEFKSNNLALTNKYYRKNQLFVFDDVRSHGENYEEKLSLAYAGVDYPYLALIQDYKIWMAVIPHEMNTMKASIAEAHGHVLVLGLGLGYYPFHIALKDEVISIVIVEKNQTIINIFNKYIFPKFSNKEKFTIIHEDAYQFMKLNHQDFDYAFFDIYRSSNEDLDLYLKAKRFERFYPDLKISYWLESSMLAHLRRVLITYIKEVYYGYVAEEKSALDRLIETLAKRLERTTLNNYQDVLNLLSDQSILNLIR